MKECNTGKAEMAADSNALDLHFVPAVPAHMRQEVEQLFFFNARQGLLIDKIRRAVDRYGVPEIISWNGQLRIGVPANDVQCLFALDQTGGPGRIAAVVLYLRAVPECLTITHLAVHQDYVGGAMGARVIGEVRRIARRIRGVVRIELPYNAGCFLQLHE
jgi:hypothetical protein